MKISAFFTLTLGTLAAGAGTAASAQSYSQPVRQSGDWQAWHGCWQGSDSASDEVLCVVPDGAGVRMVTVVNGTVQADSRVVADGVAHRSQSDGCTSSETARWSSDRHRIFLNSEMSCNGGVTRNVRGMLTFISQDEWLSVQTVSGDDGTATRAVRFTPAADARVPRNILNALDNSRARVAPAFSFDEADVKEAASFLDAAAVQEWLDDADAPYELADGSVTTGGSALVQLGRMSHGVTYNHEVVRIVERPVYVVRSYGSRRYAYCWTPWGYDHYGWHARPIIQIRLPIVIYRGGHDRYDHGRYYYTNGGRSRDYDNHRNNDGGWRGRNDNSSRDNNSRDNYDHGRGNNNDNSRNHRVTPGGYSSGSTAIVRQLPEKTEQRTEGTGRTVRTEQSVRTERAAPSERSQRSEPERSAPARSSSSSSHTARARSK